MIISSHVSVFAFLKCVAISFAGVASHELFILLQKLMTWHDANRLRRFEKTMWTRLAWQQRRHPTFATLDQLTIITASGASADYHHYRPGIEWVTIH